MSEQTEPNRTAAIANFATAATERQFELGATCKQGLQVRLAPKYGNTDLFLAESVVKKNLTTAAGSKCH